MLKLEMNSQKKDGNIVVLEKRMECVEPTNETHSRKESALKQEKTTQAMGAESECEAISWTSKFYRQCWMAINKLFSTSGPHLCHLQKV